VATSDASIAKQLFPWVSRTPSDSASVDFRPDNNILPVLTALSTFNSLQGKGPVVFSAMPRDETKISKYLSGLFLQKREPLWKE
jgi:hypothetical protein